MLGLQSEENVFLKAKLIWKQLRWSHQLHRRYFCQHLKPVKFLLPEGEVLLLLFEKPAEQMTRKISIIYSVYLLPFCFQFRLLDTQIYLGRAHKSKK